MKFMMIIKSDRHTEAGVIPAEKVLIAMGRYNEELIRAGVLLSADGLQPSSKGARVRHANGKTSVTDGPFAQSNEFAAGYWIIQVKSKAEAIEWAKRVPFDRNGPSATSDGGGEIELRQLFEAANLTADLHINSKRKKMISHIHAVTIVVSNQDKAIDYYVNVLGWKKTDDAPMGPGMRWVTVSPKGAETSFSLSLPSWYTRKPSLEMGINTGIAFSTPDMKATFAELSKRGVNFKGEPEMMPWGKPGVWFLDPDANEFFMAEA